MSMNIYRLTGDVSHMISVCLLLFLVFHKKDGRGLSFRSQELFLLTFLTRYMDLFTTFYSMYNSMLKIFYISATAALLYKIQKKNEDGSCVHDAARDVFPHVPYLVLPCCVLAFGTHCWGSGLRNFDLLELFWTFSIYMESVAILPQLVLLQKYRIIQPLLAQAIICMGLYRWLYIVNWVYRAHTEKGYQHHWVVYACGIVQTVLYADFFYSYSVKCKANASAASSDNTVSSPSDSSGETQDDSSQEGNSSNKQLTYKPLLQNKVCCCQHVAKDEEEEEEESSTYGNEEEVVIEESDNSNESQQSNKSDKALPSAGSTTAIPPPMLIFKGHPCAPIFVVSYLIMGWLLAMSYGHDSIVGIYVGVLIWGGILFVVNRVSRTLATPTAPSVDSPGPASDSASDDLKTPLLEAEPPSGDDEVKDEEQAAE